MRRLLYMTDTIQRTAAALPRSIRQRTDAELCLLRLCDESLSNDTEALAGRVSALEDALKKGASNVKEKAADAVADAKKAAEGDAAPFVDSPYGEGSFVGAEPPEGFRIKGNERSMKFHVPEDVPE